MIVPAIKTVGILGRKPGASDALDYVIAKGLSVSWVVTQKNDPYASSLAKNAHKRGITIYNDITEVYSLLKRGELSQVDVVLSYLFWEKIRKPLFIFPQYGCINFHPAPLPDYKSRAGYNTAILDDRSSYGVSAHYIDSEKFDSGPIIKVLDFPIDVKKINAVQLEQLTQQKLYLLFVDVINILCAGLPIQTLPNEGGLYLTTEQLEDLKTIDLVSDSEDVIHRKIRAFFFPPYTGAYIKIGEEKYTLINKDILQFLADIIVSWKNNNKLK